MALFPPLLLIRSTQLCPGPRRTVKGGTSPCLRTSLPGETRKNPRQALRQGGELARLVPPLAMCSVRWFIAPPRVPWRSPCLVMVLPQAPRPPLTHPGRASPCTEQDSVVNAPCLGSHCFTTWCFFRGVCDEGERFHWDDSEKVTKVWWLLLVVFSLFSEWENVETNGDGLSLWETGFVRVHAHAHTLMHAHIHTTPVSPCVRFSCFLLGPLGTPWLHGERR